MDIPEPDDIVCYVDVPHKKPNPTAVRFPPDVLWWLRNRAESSGATLNGLIVSVVRNHITEAGDIPVAADVDVC